MISTQEQFNRSADYLLSNYYQMLCLFQNNVFIAYVFYL